MVMVSKLKNTVITFGKFTDEIQKFATSSSGESCIDIVFDVHQESFIKNAERGTCEIGKLEFKIIVNGQRIKQYGAFFSSDKNMPRLSRFLAKWWEENFIYWTSNNAQKMTFSIKKFFSKLMQIWKSPFMFVFI